MMTSSKALFYFCLCFIFGIALSSLIKIPQIFFWGFLFVGVLIIITSAILNKNTFIVVGFCAVFFVIGFARFQISEFATLSDALSRLNNQPEKITLSGYVVAQPDLRDSLQKLKVKVNSSVVLVTAQRYPEYHYLDTIKMTGKLKAPEVFDDFNYKSYLMKDGIYSVMDFPKIELVSQKHHYTTTTFLYEKLLFVKNILENSLDNNFSPPNSFIMQGVVFGNDKNMSQELKDAFNATGLSHLTAVSGSNIIILIYLLMPSLLFLGLWRGQAFYFAVILIWVYVLLIGFPASSIRAVIMGSILLLAEKLGRQNTSSRVLILACALMLLQNPFLLVYDVGFQLSFLASMGIIYLKPIIDFAINKITKDLPSRSKKAKMMIDIVSVTLAAQIFTLPIIVFNFGRLSLIAPITNVLVLPIIPYLTVLGFFVSIFGALSNALGFILSLPGLFLLGYFLKVMDIFHQPWAATTVENISWVWVLGYYLLLAFLIRLINKKQKQNYLRN